MLFYRHRITATLLFPLCLLINSEALAKKNTASNAENGAGSVVDQTTCHQNYYQSTAPKFVNPALARETQELCFDGFTVMYSAVTRTPLWSAEYLTKARLDNAKTLDRQNQFHEEPQLDSEKRATLADYKGSGFDRGHLSPNGDMGTRAQQFNSFSLANMVPQNSYNNQNPWRLLEEATRELVKQEGEAYVITGAAFRGTNLRKIGNVIVPSDVYKVVYFPKRQAAGVYFSPNDASGQVNVISLAELNSQIGMDLLSNLSASVKQQRIDMPLTTKTVMRHDNSSSRPNHSTPKNDQSMNNNGATSAQLQPETRGLLARLWYALWHSH